MYFRGASPSRIFTSAASPITKRPAPSTGPDVDENWQDWQPAEYIRNLTHPIAEKGFKADLDAMRWADTCVLVLPCGRCAHT